MGARDEKTIPTSRLRRSTKMGKLAAGEAVKQAGTRAANVLRNDEKASAALAKRQIETAERIVEVLGTMKGAAMKLGQVMSFLDVGLVPDEYRDEFQAKLAQLRDSAPKVSFGQMRHVIEAEYEEKIEDVFESFDPVPVAAASIGQVYRARMHDGRDVAVKVQYPGVAQAVRSDIKNLGIILRLMKQMAPGLDAKATAGEIRERIEEELDYELEAQNQRALARIYRGHPFIVVPDVVPSLSRERVMVTEFVQGRGFEEIKQLPQEQRNRIAEIIFRFYFGCMYRHYQFSGDPHPGNLILLDDGRVAFLDFGLYKRIDPSIAEFELKAQKFGIERDGAGLIQHMVAGGFIKDATRYEEAGILDQFDDFTRWYTADEELELEPEVATKVMIEMSDMRSSYFDTMKHETLPPDHLFGRRLEMLTLAVMSQLRVKANWHRIAREWIIGAQPVTELGKQEAEFFDNI